jgi:L-alanine-DL-glutamate epimerase-like enolase superfamily enzyme
MRLNDIETFVVGNPPPRRGGRYFIFLTLRTACGITGVGEIYAASFSPHLIAKLAEDLFARWFEGEDPRRLEALRRRALGGGYVARPDPTLCGALSGLDMACWDILGKAADLPVHVMLGGRVRETLRTYTYLYPEGDTYPDGPGPTVYDDPDMAAEAAAKAVAEGFTAVKFDPAGPYTVYDPHQPRLDDIDRSEAFCRKIREAVGSKADILFGTHGQFTVAGAKRLARRLEPHDPLWFEEPTPADAPERMAEVARATAIPVAAGERLCGYAEFARLVETGAAAILQPNLGRLGGLREARCVAALAEAHYAQVAPHLYCGPVVGAAAIQLALAIPNFLILEGIGKWDGFHADILKTPIRWQDGHVIPPEGPGLGVELNEALARATPYAGDTLHLTVAPHSIEDRPA